MQDLEGPITAKGEQVRAKFRTLLDKTNKENPHPVITAPEVSELRLIARLVEKMLAKPVVVTRGGN